MIEEVKTKLEDETMDVEGPGDENDPNNPFNRRGEKRGKRGKCKVVSKHFFYKKYHRNLKYIDSHVLILIHRMITFLDLREF